MALQIKSFCPVTWPRCYLFSANPARCASPRYLPLAERHFSTQGIFSDSGHAFCPRDSPLDEVTPRCFCIHTESACSLNTTSRFDQLLFPEGLFLGNILIAGARNSQEVADFPAAPHSPVPLPPHQMRRGPSHCFHFAGLRAFFACEFEDSVL